MAVIVFIFFASPSILSESTTRLINHNKQFIKSTIQLRNPKQNLSAVQGSDYTLMVKLTGDEIPSELYLEDGVNTFKLNKENTIRFNYTFKNIQK